MLSILLYLEIVVCMYILLKGSKCVIIFADISPSIVLFAFQVKVEVIDLPPQFSLCVLFACLFLAYNHADLLSCSSRG